MTIDKEFKSLIPPLTPEEYKGLEESILTEGCRDALVVWGDTLVDGHNRYKICTEHNIPYKTVQKDFTDRNEAKLWIMKNQLARRNLNDFQRIEVTHKCEDAVKAKAKERQGTRSDLRNFPPLFSPNGPDRIFQDGVCYLNPLKTKKSQNDLQTSGQNCPKVEQQVKRATDELAEMANVGRKTYEHAVEVIEKAPESIVQATRNDELSINAAYLVTKMPEKEQTEVVERIEKGEKPKDVVADVRSRAGVSNKTYEKAVKIITEAPEEIKKAVRSGDISINKAYNDLKKAERKADIERQAKELRENPPEMPDGLFDVIVIDPAWNYGTEYSSTGRRVANPYPEMTQDELKKIEIPAKNDCVMFLWTTHKFIWNAKELLDLWGFEYRNMLVWDKKLMGMGNLIRMQCEFCLMGIKGTPFFNDVHDIRDIIEEPRREHSRKPDAFYEIVDRLCTGRKLDYFSRQQRKGWEVFGNDTNRFSVA